MKTLAAGALCAVLFVAGAVFGQARPHPPAPSPQTPAAVAPEAPKPPPPAPLAELQAVERIVAGLDAALGALSRSQADLDRRLTALEAGQKPAPIPTPFPSPIPSPPVVTADVVPELVTAYEDLFRAELGAWGVVGSAGDSFHALNDQLAAVRQQLRAKAFDASTAHTRPLLDARTGRPTDPAGYRDECDRVGRSLREGMRKALGP